MSESNDPTEIVAVWPCAMTSRWHAVQRSGRQKMIAAELAQQLWQDLDGETLWDEVVGICEELLNLCDRYVVACKLAVVDIWQRVVFARPRRFRQLKAIERRHQDGDVRYGPTPREAEDVRRMRMWGW